MSIGRRIAEAADEEQSTRAQWVAYRACHRRQWRHRPGGGEPVRGEGRLCLRDRPSPARVGSLRQRDWKKMQPACRETYRTLPISIASLLKSSRKRGD
jgi:hypothetical protein